LAFAAAFFLRSAHRFFIISDSFLRPQGGTPKVRQAEELPAQNRLTG
jgi:hypothetical protein